MAANQVDTLAAEFERTVSWQPILLGPMLKVTGRQPLLDIPLVGEYARHDLARSARRLQIPWHLPDKFPLFTLTACRAYYFIEHDDPERARAFARAVYHGYFAENRDISQTSEVLSIAAALGIDPAILSAGIKEAKIKRQLREKIEHAMKVGVFGSPVLLIDGEPFWGFDRFDEARLWLQSRW